MPRNRLQEQSKDCVDRMQRLNAVVRKWQCSRGSADCGYQLPPSTRAKNANDNLLDKEDESSLKAIKPIIMNKDENEVLRDEVKLYMMGRNLNVCDKLEKEMLKQQARMAVNLSAKRKLITKTVVERMQETEEALRSDAKWRIETRKILQEAQAGADKCYKELDKTLVRQQAMLGDYDKYIHNIEKEISRLKSYKNTGFPKDQRKIQLLLEDKRLFDDGFYDLHGQEMEEMRGQLRTIESDLARFDPDDKKKILQRLCWQIRNMRLEPVSYEKELIRSDTVILEAQLQNIKNDVAFMQDRYLKLLLCDDPYSSQTEL